MNAAWREADEALLERLADEAVFERYWAAIADGAPPPHPRAAGSIAALRRTDSGREAVAQAEAGDVGPLVRFAAEPPPDMLTPRSAHHLALVHAAAADGLERRDDPARRGSGKWPRLRALAMWLWLAEEGAYLKEMAGAVIGGGLPPNEVERAATEAPYRVLDALGERARSGARELSEPARVALRVLAQVDVAAEMAGVGERVRRIARTRAARAREAAIDDAIQRIDHALEEARGRDAPTDELVALLADAVAVWRWADRDEHVERFLIERVTPTCWDRYREKRLDELRGLLRPLEAPVDHLAERVENDPTRLAYAAPCAQMFVFRAEVAPKFDAQLAAAERAVQLCATHRNGRLVLANFLVERGMRALDGAMPWGRAEALRRAAEDVRRAASLYPDSEAPAERQAAPQGDGEGPRCRLTTRTRSNASRSIPSAGRARSPSACGSSSRTPRTRRPRRPSAPPGKS